MKSKNAPQLEHLGLRRFYSSMKVFEQLSHLATHWTLQTLDLSHLRDATGQFAILFQCEFSMLRRLILHDCELNEEDLKSLDEANAQGRLPVLVDLDISKNDHLTGNIVILCLKRIQLKTLKLDSKPSSYILQSLPLGKNSVPSTKELKQALYTTDGFDISRTILGQLNYLERLDIVDSEDDHIKSVLTSIPNAIEKGCFPALQTVCICTNNATVSGDAKDFLVFREKGVELYFIHSWASYCLNLLSLS